MDDVRRSRHEIPADAEGLAGTRVRFLNSEAVEPERVRDTILASWWRSRDFRVPADRIDLPYTRDQDLDTPLVRAAAPVLARLSEQLDGQPISLILTDPTGLVLTRQTGDADLSRHLESVELAPGFSYGERFVGTNGIGTALEEGRPTHVFGHEHYAENLENLACAGAPIRHPISGKTVGAVDLTCWRRDAGQLLVVLARSTADQIREELLTYSNRDELALFRAYLRACRRTTGVVIAFNDDVVMMNDRARKLLDASDQAVLLGHAGTVMSTGRESTTTMSLPTGGKVRLNCRRVHGDGDATVGGVIHLDLIEVDDEATEITTPTLPTFLPGVVGSTPVWLRCCHDVDASYARGDWLVLTGESGTGRTALTRCVHRRHDPTGRMRVVDAASAGQDWAADLRRDLVEDPVSALIVRHVDRLTGAALAATAGVLREVDALDGRRRPWVALTMAADAEPDSPLAELLALFPRTVQVPPLRGHAEDIRELVPLFLSKLGHGGRLSSSPAAMHLLMRGSWPGNVSQLHDVLREVVRRRRTGMIQAADLPPEVRALTRRPLNRLESMERDAIVQSLDDAGGNKVRAAALLGMSRATLYRKIHEYGIVLPGR
ncbi:MAG TPA: GAF domain-containing protein [Streptosporangiales bacterium]